MKRWIAACAALAVAAAVIWLIRRPAPKMDVSQTAAIETLAPAQTFEEILATPGPEFQEPCVEGPYDYHYIDENMQILIRRFQQDETAYLIADIQLTDVKQFRTALSGDQPFGSLEKLSDMAARAGAVLAVNADDYGVHKYGTIIRNGQLLRAHDTTRNMLIVDSNGDMRVRVDRSGEDPDMLGTQLLAENVWQSFEFGPELIRDGQTVEFSAAFDLISTAPSRREPRTAIGQIGPLHYVVIVVDGRQPGWSVGMTLPELQQLFLQCGAQTAMNLDGGDSAEMWFHGEIISRPSQGGERSISDIICF